MERRLRLAATGAPASAVAPALVAAVAAPEPEATVAVAPAVVADIAPWPGESDEASFLADTRAGGGELAPPPAAAPDEGAAERDLPPLDALVARVPAEVREALDDLFRAKFTRVRRVSPSALQP